MHIKLQKWAAIVICAAGGTALLYLLFRHTLPAFLPFLPAFLLSLATHPLSQRLAARTGWSPRVSAFLVTLFSLAALSLFLTLLCNRLLIELQRLLQLVAEDSGKEEGVIARTVAFFRSISQHLPLLSGVQGSPLLQEWIGDPQSYLQQQLHHFLAMLTERMAAVATGLLRRLPGVLWLLLSFLISSFYFAMDHDAVMRVLQRLVPPGLRARLPAWRARVREGAKRCVRAYLLLFLLTLSELLVGFLLLGVRAPFLLALLTAFLDILPVLGVGVVLLPLALITLIGGEVGRGIGMLVLYAVISVVRQIAEPRLVGKSIGLHPLLTLISFYVGIRAFGVWGVLIGPAAALLLRELFGRTEQEKI